VIPRIPLATYRVQFHRDFTFQDARELVPYLRELGISHVYASPYLKARPGSRHGYDIVDHSALNPELGSQHDYDDFCATLAAYDMGQILDIVPNHMAVGGADNPWWLDVLEHGPASRFADYFDIDWQSAKQELYGKVLVPLLEDHYGSVLEKGLLTLRFDDECGEFWIQYYEHRFPLDPKSYALILSPQIEMLVPRLGRKNPDLVAYQQLVDDLNALPGQQDSVPERRAARMPAQQAAKQQLAALCQRAPVLAEFVAANVKLYNGEAGNPESFDLLHALLERQAYRLAFWRVASDEINYRRFFDINTLAALRMELPEVFDATHRLVLELIERGHVHGLRLDHPDGLYDPAQYFERLQQAIAARTGGSERLYTVAEKILAPNETLPAHWAVHGTTGYDFAALAGGLLVQPNGADRLTELYERAERRALSYADLVYERKKLIMHTLLSGELMVLATLLDRLSEASRYTRDYTLHALRDALMELVACVPIYRTYITAFGASEQDLAYLGRALAEARRRSPAADPSVFDFLREVLHPEALAAKPPWLRTRCIDFAMRLQQFTAPVMAKGLEDTSFYVYNRLVSLNEVGDDPRRFGVSLETFHRANRERLEHWPHALLAGSTHDSKRSEDVRARLHVLSELPEEWGRHVARWSRLNRRHRRETEDGSLPSRNDEYLLYQTLLGVWPLAPLDKHGLDALRERIEAYMLKAAREAKTDTSWINQNREYEDALVAFVRALLGTPTRNAFLDEFLPFQRRVARLGLFNSLSQTLLRLTAPGVPDVYQGNELWEFSLVDPDNRRPVDYTTRRALLAELKALAPYRAETPGDRARALLEPLDDGRAKLYIIWRALWLRRQWPDIFARGAYLPLAVEGARAEHLCCYARCSDTDAVLVVAPRWFARLLGNDTALPLGDDLWRDHWIEGAPGHGRYLNVLTGESVSANTRHGRAWLAAGAALRNYPVALLIAGPNVASLLV
jgi:(1->4)-alpha-D-glucan 1-alpha-D-glucosylmutase